MGARRSRRHERRRVCFFTPGAAASFARHNVSTDPLPLYRCTVSEPFWRGWFQGLSKAFLAPSHPKMLLLAGVDRLDKDLTIGQMQGALANACGLPQP